MRRLLARVLSSHRGACGLALALPLCLATPAAAAEPAPAPVAVLKTPRGFIDDPLALSADGRTLYYVNTDGATWAELHSAVLPPHAPRAPGDAASEPATLRPDAVLSAAPLYPTKLLLLPGDRVLVVERDPQRGTLSAQVLTPKDPRKDRVKLGPADDITVGEHGGRPQVVLYSGAAQGAQDQGARADKAAKGEAPGELKLRLYDAATLKPGVARSLRVLPADGGVILPGASREGAPATPLALTDRYLTLLARVPGAFDKKKADLRQPDQLIAYDLVQSRVLRSAPVQSATALLELSALRQRHPGETAFLAHLPERRAVELVGSHDPASADLFLGARTPLRWPRPFGLYEPGTLRYQLTAEGRLYVSLTVDPVNDAAVARKKADEDIIDLCGVDAAAGQATRLLALPGNKRRSTFAVVALPGGTRFALLRKHKGFPRGGAELEIYDVAQAPPLLSRPPEAPAAPSPPQAPAAPTPKAQ